MLPRVKAAIAAEESRQISSRIRSKHQELVEKGAPSGGTRPFGLTDVVRDDAGNTSRELKPEEAEAIREAANDILAGASVKSICRRWEAQGLHGTRGHRFSPHVVATILSSEWVVGRRQGKPARWPAILDEQTWRLVSALVKGRATGRSYPKTLFSGIATCGVCGHPLVSRPRADAKPAYVCAKDQRGCGKIRIMAAYFEEDVMERLFSRLDEAQLQVPDRPADDPTAATMAEMARLEAVKEGLAEAVGAGEMDRAEFRAAKAANDQKLRALRQTMARSAQEEALERTRAEAVDLRTRWAELDIDAKRQFVRALAERIEVMPVAVRGRNFYTPERVRVTHG